MSQNIRKIFIANRGEIARRIAKTAKTMGMETVIICKDDHLPQYLYPYISETYRVTEEQTSTYLDGGLMISIAKQTGCDAIHPGFGFLSENAKFAADVEKSGLIWIGPSPESISMMASKASARDIAQEENIPLVPGFKLDKLDPQWSDTTEWKNFISECGYPILIKAALGGGGKGMRVVRNPSELEEAMQRAASEAKASFGSDELIVEKYLENPRHVEVQIFGDKSGSCFTIGDRDCSLQRRHQKIIEEAPAPFLHHETRSKMHHFAKRLAERVKYYSAGTVEFLIDGNSGQEQDVFFLELNTRLQVEHPVTEQVHQVDLVALQIMVAQGQSLQEIQGICEKANDQRHSIEARIYAEDPLNNFMPSPGQVFAFIPYHDENIRWEIGIDQSDHVTTNFDPMIAKLVVTADSRDTALSRLAHALKNTILCGPKSNISFLKTLCELESFRKEQFDTFYIERNLHYLHKKINKDMDMSKKISEKVDLQGLFETAFGNEQSQHYAQKTFAKLAFFNNPLVGTRSFQKKMHYATNSYPRAQVSTGDLLTNAYGQNECFPVSLVRTPHQDIIWINANGNTIEFAYDRQVLQNTSSSQQGDENLKSPVPGKIVLNNCSDQMKCLKGQTLLVMESMKMEIEIKAPFAATIEKIYVKEGDQVEADHLLLKLKNMGE